MKSNKKRSEDGNTVYSPGDTVFRDYLAVNYVEKQIGRKLTNDEINGFKAVEVTTMDGVRAKVYIEKLPFSFFYPVEWSYEENRQNSSLQPR